MTNEDEGYSEETGYAMIMTFVVCESNDGPFDDASYSAGWEAARIDSKLAIADLLKLEVVDQIVLTKNVPQIELIAMRYGFIVNEKQEVHENEDWSLINIIKLKPLSDEEVM